MWHFWGKLNGSALRSAGAASPNLGFGQSAPLLGPVAGRLCLCRPVWLDHLRALARRRRPPLGARAVASVERIAHGRTWRPWLGALVERHLDTCGDGRIALHWLV